MQSRRHEIYHEEAFELKVRSRTLICDCARLKMWAFKINENQFLTGFSKLNGESGR